MARIKPHRAVILVAVLALLVISIRILGSRKETYSDADLTCFQLNWVSEAAFIEDSLDLPGWTSLHPVHGCVDLNVFLVRGTTRDLSNMKSIIPDVFAFRRVTFHTCYDLKCEAIRALNPDVDNGLVLLSTSPLCPAPSFLLLVEKIEEFRKSSSEKAGGYFVCDEEIKTAALLLELSFFVDMQSSQDTVNIPRFVSGIWRTGKIKDIPHLLNAPSSYAQCGAHPTCTFRKFREVDHLNSKLAQNNMFDVAEILRRRTFPDRNRQYRATTTVEPANEIVADANHTASNNTYESACTLVLTVYDRFEHVLDRLDHYSKLSVVKQILVVWNYVLQPPPKWRPSRFLVPVFVAQQAFNSMNNRFKPHPFIDTDCVINMDDDWVMPHVLLEYAVGLWHNGFQNNVIGLWKLARLHGFDQDGSLVYMYNKTMPQSMVLPSGMVFHRKYLDIYTNQLPESTRELVDLVVNCDDLLFNFMVAKVTGKAPVFVDHGSLPDVRVKSSGKKEDAKGLWKRKQHYEDRDMCLNSFTKAFGENPLKYTTSRFLYNTRRIYPLVEEHVSIPNERVRCTTCEGDAIDDCVTCTIS